METTGGNPPYCGAAALKYDPGAEVSTREISLQLPGKTDGGNKECESEETSVNERAEATVRNESQSAGPAFAWARGGNPILTLMNWDWKKLCPS